jgi:hypothetical protein
VLLLYGAKKVLEGRSAPDTAVPRAVGAATASERIPPRSLQRQAAMHQQKDAWEEARLLADLWLQSACGIGVDEAGPEHLIDIQVSGSIWSRWRLRRHANFLLELIHSAEPFEVSRSQFAAFVRALPVLCKAVHDGRLALLLDGKEVRKTTEPEA